MIDQELEDLLRRTLAGRAETVGAGPDWVAPQPEPPRTSHPAGHRPAGHHPAGHRAQRRRWPAVLAAAVVAALVGVGAWVARSMTHSAPRPATGSSSTVARPVVAATCRAVLPAAWTHALQSARVDAGGRTATPLSVSADGTVLALRDFGPAPGSRREVVAVRPSGVSVLYEVPQPDRFTATSAYLDGGTLLIGLADAARPPRGTIPGSSSIGLRAVVAVDPATGRSRTLAGGLSGRPGPSIQALVHLDGVGYWDVEASYGAATGSLDSYDLRAGLGGTVRTAYRGPIGWPAADAAGVGWSDSAPGGFRFAVTHRLPAPVEQAMTPFARARLATDGTAYAWYVSTAVLGWWAPGERAPSYLRLPAPVDAERSLGGPLVSGRFVLTSAVVDVTTRAVAPLPTTGLFSTAARGELLYGGGPVLGGLVMGTPPGHFVDGYWADTPVHPLRLDVTGLPRLSC